MFQSTRPRGARPPIERIIPCESEFQSTRPRGARPRAPWDALSPLSFQSTRPRGARRRGRPAAARRWGFNPRARVGRDIRMSSSFWLQTCFNPRARVGRDIKAGTIRDRAGKFQSTRPRGARPFACQVVDIGQLVSIHAPAWGATRRKSSSPQDRPSFNPRARVGRDLDGLFLCGKADCFNPRARVGRDCLLTGQIPTIRQSNLTSKPQQS